ncbi:MAG: bifunctional hydroxymethylpyrimidine kinase/phosphomethylpyrimidine kinase [Prevotellaceae bacterium]|jgi:hydroxymethylpyrimidine/phosphomethylpyrimidine kinase|nr:bifunctional hydroxymethylpyrimidine kinase/phosphomethylpyrimidine kinase [Prevotellaceae bacterium]
MNEAIHYPVALTIAGSDSGGCAGIQADLKTFSAIGVFGTSVITAITAQNTQEVRAIEILSPSIIRQQLEATLDDIPAKATKIGMLPSPEIVEVVAEIIDRYRLKNVVLDPVMVSTSGARLTSALTTDAFRQELYRRATIITPNVPEAEALSGVTIRTEKDFRKAAEALLNQGCHAVLIKGGHLSSDCSVDMLFQQSGEPFSLVSPRLSTANLHGAGCTLSSAIVAYRARGLTWARALDMAKNYVNFAILYGGDVTTGKGRGPLNHFFNPQPLEGVQEAPPKPKSKPKSKSNAKPKPKPNAKPKSNDI